MAFLSIDELNLSVRAKRCLEKAGIDTIEKLIETSDDKLKAIEGMGATSLSDIKNALVEFKVDEVGNLNEDLKKVREKIAQLQGQEKALLDKIQYVGSVAMRIRVGRKR